MPWKTLDRNTVFISFSRDMTREAKVVETVIDELNRKVPEGDRWEVFRWPKSDMVWSTEASWQEHIPRTSDPKCQLLICLLGERLGEPLPEYFPLPEDLTLPPWVAFASAVGDTRIPLTGTLFEYLDRIYGPRPGGRALCYLKADARKVSNRHSNEIRDREYGFCHHFDELRGGRRRPPESQEAEYDRQLVELDRFAGHEFRDGGRPFICFGHIDASPAECLEHLRAALRRDLPNVLGIRLAPEPREPKGLETYGIGDADFIFGRDKPIVGVLQKLKDLTESPPQIPIVTLTGRSGEGKSSLLQAGLIGRLSAGQYSDFGRFVPVLLEPFRLQQTDPFSGFAQALNDALGGSLFDGKHDVSDFMLPERIDKLLQAVREQLRERSDQVSPARLFLGVDQVEELLFAGQNDPGVADGLEMFCRALERLAVERLAVVVLALPSEHLNRLASAAPTLSRTEFPLLPPGDLDLQDIIRETFKKSHAALPEESIDKIVVEAIAWRRRQQDSGPILPLLSVLMREWASVEQVKSAGNADSTAENVEPSETPHLDSVIGRLGERAWAEAGGDRTPGLDRALARIFRQLIVTGRAGGEVLKILRNAAAEHDALRDAPPMVRALRRHRLLFSPAPDVVRLAHASIVDGWARAAQWYSEDREHHETLAEIEPRAERWRKEQGRVGRVITDPEDLDRIEDLWGTWKVDAERLPTDFMRACLDGCVNEFARAGAFARNDGGSRFSLAMAIADERLSNRWFSAIAAVDPGQARSIIEFRSTQSGNTALITAATWGGYAEVEWLVEHGASVEAANNDGWTPLLASASRGDTAAAKLLLARSANSEARTNDGVRPLHLAAANGHEQITRMLLENRANIEAQIKNQRTPLHFAAASGHEQITRLLLENRANIEAQDKDQWRPLHLAIANGHAGVTRLLIDAGADIEARSHDATSLHLAAESGHDPIVRLLVEAGADVGARHRRQDTPLHLASEHGHGGAARALLDCRADLEARDADWLTPLHRAAAKGQAAIIHLLADHGADIDAQDQKGSTALHIACQWDRPISIKALLTRKADTDLRNKDGLTPLLLSAYHGDEVAVQCLLDHGVSLSIPTPEGITPLAAATGSGNADLVSLLLGHGAEPEPDSPIIKPLIRAAQCGSEEDIGILCDHGAVADAPDSRGLSPLMYASWFGHAAAVQRLLERGADPNAVGPRGWTPLMFAAVGNWTIRPSNSAEAIRILLAGGAKANAREDSGRDVATLVRQHGSSVAANILLGDNIDGPSKAIRSPVTIVGGLGSPLDGINIELGLLANGQLFIMSDKRLPVELVCLIFDINLNRLVFHFLAPDGVRYLESAEHPLPVGLELATYLKRSPTVLFVEKNEITGKLEGMHVSVLQLREKRALDALLSGEFSDGDVIVKFSYTSIEITLKGTAQAFDIGRLEYGVLSHQLVLRSRMGEIVKAMPIEEHWQPSLIKATQVIVKRANAREKDQMACEWHGSVELIFDQ
jgi:ankyrin repeat protein